MREYAKELNSVNARAALNNKTPVFQLLLIWIPLIGRYIHKLNRIKCDWL